MPVRDIAVVIPHYQQTTGLLSRAVKSAFSQTRSDRLLVIVCDDGSPSPARSELDTLVEVPRDQLLIVERVNGGAGAARNTAIEAIPEGFKFVAFLDSDDAWRPHHIEYALAAMDAGYDAYFANFIGVG